MYKAIPSKISADKKLKIQFLDCEEINNGRMLWKVSIFYENVNLDKIIFPQGWNYLNFELDKWTLEDKESRFYYIPIESKSILIEAKTLKIHYLSNQSLSTIYFKGNYFVEHFLIEEYGDVSIKTSLETFDSEEITTKN
ncbi:hypothetical protein V9L05_13130 [Bernardetia sp. Wsw4-3y2]|uniref:hypothetical protein n=1 Tax=Bernardetia sp. Wsw4-3y2 TaxID=3127471 RepID=UPI0030CFE04E